MKINKDEKIIFTLRIGDGGNGNEEEFTLNELGFDEQEHHDIAEFIEQEWKDWKNNLTEGGCVSKTIALW